MLTPEDLSHRLVEEAGEGAIASAAGTSVAQAERDLAAAGFDVKAERARANERIAELTGENASGSRTGAARCGRLPRRDGLRAAAASSSTLLAIVACSSA